MKELRPRPGHVIPVACLAGDFFGGPAVSVWGPSRPRPRPDCGRPGPDRGCARPSIAARDHRSDARDDRAEERERNQTYDPTAAADRAGAKRDRQGSANDRKHAEHDRVAAATDRALSARERDVLLVDALTGVHRREAGSMELEREIVKARRTGHLFVSHSSTSMDSRRRTTRRVTPPGTSC